MWMNIRVKRVDTLMLSEQVHFSPMDSVKWYKPIQFLIKKRF